MKYFNNAIGFVGLACTAYGAFQFHPALAWCIAGIPLFAAGVAGEVARARKPKDSKQP